MAYYLPTNNNGGSSSSASFFVPTQVPMSAPSINTNFPTIGGLGNSILSGITFGIPDNLVWPINNPYRLLPDNLLNFMIARDGDHEDLNAVSSTLGWEPEVKRVHFWTRDTISRTEVTARWNNIHLLGTKGLPIQDLLFYGIYSGVDYHNVSSSIYVRQYHDAMNALSSSTNEVTRRFTAYTIAPEVLRDVAKSFIPKEIASIITLLTEDEVRNVITLGRLPEEYKYYARYAPNAETLNKLKPWQLTVLTEYLGVERSIPVMARQNIPDAVIQLLINLDQYPTAALASSLGIVAPGYSKKEHVMRSYIERNLSHLLKVLVRQGIGMPTLDWFRDTYPVSSPETKQLAFGHLCLMTDAEVISVFDILVPHDGFEGLRSMMLSYCLQPSFFIPLKRDASKITNKETFYGDSTMDMEVPMIAYGYPWSYRLYGLEELYNSFDMDNRDANDISIIGFPKPEDVEQSFDNSDITRLLECLRHSKRMIINGIGVYPVDRINELINRIESNRMKYGDTEDIDVTIRDEFLTFSPMKVDLFKEYLLAVFYVGMYMRRWKGPGHSFPVSSSDTEGVSAAKTKTNVGMQVDAVYKILKHAREMGHSLDEFWPRLQTFSFWDKTYNMGTQRMDVFWRSITTGKACIRVGSAYMIGTAARYLVEFYNIDVSSINGLDPIS